MVTSYHTTLVHRSQENTNRCRRRKKTFILKLKIGKVLIGAIQLCCTVFIQRCIQANTTQYTVNNIQLATCFSSNKPSSGQYLIYGHGEFSECVQCGTQYCLVILVASVNHTQAHVSFYSAKEIGYRHGINNKKSFNSNRHNHIAKSTQFAKHIRVLNTVSLIMKTTPINSSNTYT